MDIFEDYSLPEESEEENYYKKKKVSSSFLKEFKKAYKAERLDTFVYESGDTNATREGNIIHDAMETQGESLNKLVVVDDSCLKKFTSNEKKILAEGITLENYCKYYSNPDTKKYLAGDNKAWVKLTAILDELSKKAEETGYYEYMSKLNSVETEGLIDCTPFGGEMFINIVKKSYRNLCEVEPTGAFDYSERELELSGEILGVEVKGKVDRMVAMDEESHLDVTLIDYKSFTGSIYFNFRKFEIINQQSLYCELLTQWFRQQGVTKPIRISSFIHAVSRDNGKVEVIRLHPHAIQYGRTGGFWKPSLYTKHEELGYQPYLDEEQIEFLVTSKIWKGRFHENNPAKEIGWEELIKYISENKEMLSQWLN